MPPAENSRSSALERHLALPVMVCAAVSVPAIFLDLWGEGIWGRIGRQVNWAAGLALWAEWILLIVLAKDKRAWLRTHRWTTFIAVLTVPALLFTLGPAQVLRLVRAAGTLRLARVTRIIEAGGVLRRRLGLRGKAGVTALVVTMVLSAAFVVTVLADPESASRRFLADLPGSLPSERIAAALLLVAVTTALILYLRRRATSGPEDASGADVPDQSP